jgi:hypothetical protein
LLAAGLTEEQILQDFEQFREGSRTGVTFLQIAVDANPLIAAPESELLDALTALPITTVAPYRYRHALPTALSLIGQRDAKDAELLALALALHIPVWSNDKDFDGIPGVVRLSTEEMVRCYLTPPDTSAQ